MMQAAPNIARMVALARQLQDEAKRLADAMEAEQTMLAGQMYGLSDREFQVLQMVALGYGGKEIAGILNLSPKTVETYRARAADKLDLPSRRHIVHHAIRAGWMQDPDWKETA